MNVQLADMDDDVAAPADSLRGTVEQIINANPSERWTTQKILAHLKQIKYPLRARQPIYSVGQTLNILAKKGKIRLARKGGGSAPNIYRGKLPAGQTSETEAPSEARPEDVE